MIAANLSEQIRLPEGWSPSKAALDRAMCRSLRQDFCRTCDRRGNCKIKQGSIDANKMEIPYEHTSLQVMARADETRAICTFYSSTERRLYSDKESKLDYHLPILGGV